MDDTTVQFLVILAIVIIAGLWFANWFRNANIKAKETVRQKEVELNNWHSQRGSKELHLSKLYDELGKGLITEEEYERAKYEYRMWMRATDGTPYRVPHGERRVYGTAHERITYLLHNPADADFVHKSIQRLLEQDPHMNLEDRQTILGISIIGDERKPRPEPPPQPTKVIKGFNS